MLQVNMHEAMTRLSRPVELVENGERVVIARGGVPVAELDPRRARHALRRGGQGRGQTRIADDCDAPLPEVDERFDF